VSWYPEPVSTYALVEARAIDPRFEARPEASSSGDRAAADTFGGPAAAPKTNP
jgi:hypothetical protein